MKNVLIIFFLSLWAFLSSGSANATDIQGKVIHIAAGDTITILMTPRQISNSP